MKCLILLFGLFQVSCACAVDDPSPVVKVPIVQPAVGQFHSAKEQCALDHGVWCAAPNGTEDCWTPETCAEWHPPSCPIADINTCVQGYWVVCIGIEATQTTIACQ